ncbi:hypothetical protein L9F63_006207 [Diploptera punctata]|uniref:2-oxoglutarate and iron-dependent oxygenase JMJD4 n=1 Tax=Diploptera punctata TaxID=6984 RepID=A0AAD7ZB06_DIPPU|nr:hypothetical protein L9F63_006207 [Diploptera punctata]
MLEAGENDVLELEGGLKSERNQLQIGENTIPIESDDISYNEFFTKYLCKNLPCILQIKATKNWKSVNEWTLNKKPNFTYIAEKFGSAAVPVANCDEKYYNAQKKSDSSLSDYLIYWREYIEKCHTDLPCLYLKDWHFTRDFPDENIYRVPKYFASDWLNEYFTAKKDIKDDYRFVYMGPKGSWTPLHVDVFTSFSWSINICGRKRWILFPEGEEDCLRDKFGHLAYDATSPEMSDEKLYPAFKNLKLSIEVIQEMGEAIFVPSGWHHQVWNLEDTISINHNWVNGCNIGTMWTSLQENLMAVKKEVDDCKDMEDWNEHCQLMLQATFGMNYQEFYYFLYFIGRIRLDSLKNTSPVIIYGNWKLTRNHILFDLRQLLKVFTSVINDSDVINLTFYKNLTDSPQEFVSEIESYIL